MSLLVMAGNDIMIRQYATADNVFDYFANYQVISESGQSALCYILYASSNVFCHFYLRREEDDDDEHQELLQRDDPREQPDQ